MKNFTCFSVLILLLTTTLSLPGQPVILTLQNDLLHQVVGFVDYADCAVDMNGDFLDDVVRVGGKGIYIDYQNTDGTFSQKFFNVHVKELPSWSICAGDLDNNGLNDLLFANSSKVSFVKANETGTSYTETVMPGVILSQRSTMADINNDGWLDAFVCNDTAMSVPYRNEGFGNMLPDTNLIHTSDRPGAYSAIWTDYDNDNDIDLYITKCKGGAPPSDPDRINLLYRNNGDGSFTEVANQSGVDDNAQSWSTAFEDFDHDGDFDAFVVNHDFQNRLYRNNGDGTFTDVIEGSGIDPTDLGAFENSSGDFNNDGHIDIFSELEQELYLGNGDLTFTGQSLPVTPGAIADLNNDGFLDVVHASRPWINQPNQNHWVKINTIGIEGNLNGIGARVEIYGPFGMQVREIRSGQSYSPMSSLNTHFGLGNADRIDSLVVKWPSGVISVLTDLDADTTYIVPEANCVLHSSALSVSGDTAICPGTSIVLSAPSGFSQYSWSKGVTGATISVGEEGWYYAILTDSLGCVSITDGIRITHIEESKPIITATGQNPVCEGDTLILTASTGENYFWSEGTSGLQRIGVTQTGSYTVAVDAVCSAEKITSDPFPVTVLPTPAPQVTHIEIAPGDSILLTAAGENIHWYQDPSGGALLHTGSTFQTPALHTHTTYYVESHHTYEGELQPGGKPDTSGPGGLPSQGGYLLFEVWKPFTLLSVTVYVPPGGPAGTRFIQLVSGDSILAVKQFIVQHGLNVLELNFAVPVGQFSLRSPQGNLFRNTGPLSYPYPIGDVGQITTSSFGNDYYYYFYDWKIRTHDYECVSERVPVEVLITKTQDPVDPFTWRLYPNPTKNENVVIELEKNETGKLILFDATGRAIHRMEFESESLIPVKLEGIASGVYAIQLWSGGKVESRKLIVSKK